MSDPVYGDQFAALRQENARLRAQLDATAQAHERDVVRVARALGWTHEPPASGVLVSGPASSGSS